MSNAMKKHVTLFTLHLGPVSCTGCLVGVRLPASKNTNAKPKLNYASPDGNPVVQRYLDEATGKYYAVDELGKGTKTDDGRMVVLDTEALDELKSSELPKNVLNLTVHRRDEVEGSLFPSDNNAYVFYPGTDDPKNKGWADFIRTAVVEGGENFAFLGKCKLKNANADEGLFRLTPWRGHLVIQRQLFPSELEDHAVDTTTLPEAVTAKALAALDNLVEPFDPDTYNSEQAARLAQFVDEAKATGVSAPVQKKPTPAASFDLDSALDDLFAV